MRMNKSEIQKILTVLDHIERGGRSSEVDSSTQRQVELDRTLASMLQDVENKRADALQEMVAGELQSEEKRAWKLHTMCSCPEEGKEKEGKKKEEREE